MDIKAMIETVFNKLQGSSSLLAKFKKNPLDTVKSLLDIDLSKDILQKIVDGVKAKLAGDQAVETAQGIGGKISDAVSGIGGAISGLFGGKKK